jgi:hypothetical protein
MPELSAEGAARPLDLPNLIMFTDISRHFGFLKVNDEVGYVTRMEWLTKAHEVLAGKHEG